MTIGNRLRLLREYLGFDRQEAFAKVLGLSPKTYWRYETDNGNPAYSLLDQIIRDYDVSPTWLLTGEGEMFVTKTGSQNINAVGNEHTIISGSNNSVVSGISGGISGNAIVGLNKGRIVTKTEHQQILSDCGDEETKTEKPDISESVEKGILFEYHEGYHEGASDKKIKLVFPPGTSPEEMEVIISRSARAILSGFHENALEG